MVTLCAATVESAAVEVILAGPGKVPKEEALYVQKKTFGKVGWAPSTMCRAVLTV
jgi:hypothetical protein